MQQLVEKAKKIRLLILDMDGVMTDGRVVLSDTGEVLRNFYVQDGQAIIWLQQAGVTVACITKCNSDVVPLRMKMLGIEHIYRGQADKRVAYQELSQKLQVTDEQIAYVGDDLPDLPLIMRAGLGITVPNGVAELKQDADWCTTYSGGRGAVREVCEFIMKAQGTFSKLLAEYRVNHQYVSD